MRDPASLTPREIDLTADLLGALDSQLRLRILLLLNTGDHFVHELVSKLGKSQPLISQHLRVLKSAELVESRRAGREVVYSLAQREIIDVIAQLTRIATSEQLDSRNANLASRSTQGGAMPGGAMPGGAIAAFNEPPADIRPDADPGLRPSTPRPKKD